MSRTNIDWSKHELIIEEHDTHTVHWLKKPDTIDCNVKFTNIHGQLLVTGDFKSWVFCRGFVPSAEGCVSDYYWCEKLSIANHAMKYKEYNTSYTAERIENEFIEKVFDYHGIEVRKDFEEEILNFLKESSYYTGIDDLIEDTKNEALKEFLEDQEDFVIEELNYFINCYSNVDDEYDYVTVMREAPPSIEYEDYIIGEKLNRSLECVFDGFEEICKRLEVNEKT